MVISLTAFRVNQYGEEVRSGRVVIRKDQIAAIHNPYAYNFDENTGTLYKATWYRGGCVVHLVSGKVLHVVEQFADVEKMWLNEA